MMETEKKSLMDFYLDIPKWLFMLSAFFFFGIIYHALEFYRLHLLKNDSSLFTTFAFYSYTLLLCYFLPFLVFNISISLPENFKDLAEETRRVRIGGQRLIKPKRIRQLKRIGSLKRKIGIKFFFILLSIYIIIGISSTYIEVYGDRIDYHDGFAFQTISYPYSKVVNAQIDYIKRSKGGNETKYELTMVDGRKLNIASQGLEEGVFYYIDRKLPEHVFRVCSLGGKEGVIDKMQSDYRSYFYETYLGQPGIF